MSSRSIFAIVVLAFVVVFVMPSEVVSAHHSNALFGNELVNMDGTVVEYRWRNPHVTVVWDTTDESGKVVRWRGELASVQSVMGHGLTRTSLKPGDKISLAVFSATTGAPASVIEHILRSDGTVVLGWGQQNGASRRAAALREQPE